MTGSQWKFHMFYKWYFYVYFSIRDLFANATQTQTLNSKAITHIIAWLTIKWTLRDVLDSKIPFIPLVVISNEWIKHCRAEFMKCGILFEDSIIYLNWCENGS